MLWKKYQDMWKHFNIYKNNCVCIKTNHGMCIYIIDILFFLLDGFSVWTSDKITTIFYCFR